MPLTYEPRAAPWEHLLVEKIFQKGGNGVSGIARWLQRHVRATDYTPPGTILRTDFRRSVAELNIDVSPEDFAAVAECCAYDGDHAGEPGSLLSVRRIANRLVDLAAAGSGQASVFGQNESSPLTGTETERATLEARKAAVSEARAFNPDVEEPGRGHPHSPAAPAARSDPNSLLYDNPSGANVRAPPPPQLEAAYARGEIPTSPGAKALADYQDRRLERIGSGVDSRLTDQLDTIHIRSELGDHRHIDGSFHRRHNRGHHLWVLPHRHAIALGMRAGQIELEAIGNRCENFGHLHELVDAATKNRHQQESILGHSQLLKTLSCFFRTGIG